MDNSSRSIDHLMYSTAESLDAIDRAVNDPGELRPVVAVSVFP